MSVILETTRAVAEVAQVSGEIVMAPWERALLGFGIVMSALVGIQAMTTVVGLYFSKAGNASKKAEAAPKAAPAAPAAKPAAAAPAEEEIPLAVILAAAAYMVGGQIRSVTVTIPGRDNVTWTSQGRQSIYASHGAKAPGSVSNLGTVKK